MRGWRRSAIVVGKPTGRCVMASKRTPALELGEKLCAALRAQRDRGPESYPLSLQRLVELADPHAEPALVDKAVAGKPFKDTALVAQKNNRAAPVALAEDLEKLAASPRLLEFVLDQLCSPGSPTCGAGQAEGEGRRAAQEAFRGGRHPAAPREPAATHGRFAAGEEPSGPIPTPVAAPAAAPRSGRGAGRETAASAHVSACPRRRRLPAATPAPGRVSRPRRGHGDGQEGVRRPALRPGRRL